MRIQHIESAPSGNDYLLRLQIEESARQFQTIETRRLQLEPNGRLRVGDELVDVETEASSDLAKLAAIPVTYFSEIDAELKAVNFNSRLKHTAAESTKIEVTISNSNSIQRVQPPQFRDVPPSVLVEALLESVPRNTISNDIRVIEYERDRRFDVAVIHRGMEIEPRIGDIVCGGVHLTIEENGAVQVGHETFRLTCHNGAMARVCAGGQHRLRRGTGRDCESGCFHAAAAEDIRASFNTEAASGDYSYFTQVWWARHLLSSISPASQSLGLLQRSADHIDFVMAELERDLSDGTFDTLGCFLPREIKQLGQNGGFL